mgnify:CR=1 FL=1
MVEVRFLQSSEVLGELKGNLRDAKSFKLAVAFLKKTGYDEIRRDLVRLLEDGYPVELVIGISSYGITDWEVLRYLLDLKDKYGNLRVKYYNNEGFHPKLFVFGLPQRTKIVLGSSNLTGGGVKNNVEANVLLQGENSEEVIADIIEFFKNIFRVAENLKPDVVKKYEVISRWSRRSTKQSDKESRIRKTPLIPMPDVGVKVRIPRTPVSSLALQSRAFWKVAPGEKASKWPLWEKEIEIDKKGVMWGIIAIGWSEIEMAKLPFDSPPQVERIVTRELRRADYDSAPWYVADQARLFCKEIKKGDIAVAYSKRRIYGIAQVANEPYHVDVKDWKNETYANRRRVKWLALPYKIPDERFMRVLATNDTVHRITDSETIEMIKEELKRPSFV